jgi:hypothetical protein
MTEKEWLACDDPNPMIGHLQRRKHKPSDRKLRLFIIALWRRFQATDDRTKAAEPSLFDLMGNGLEAAEQMVDGLLQDYEFQSCWLFTNPSLRWAVQQSLTHPSLHGVVQKKIQVAILHDVVGNPFRLITINPNWLTWNDGTIRRIAQGIYEERAFDRLPILADALTDAGCDHADLLNHCRSEGPHVKGCWVVDLLLGKE